MASIRGTVVEYAGYVCRLAGNALVSDTRCHTRWNGVRGAATVGEGHATMCAATGAAHTPTRAHAPSADGCDTLAVARPRLYPSVSFRPPPPGARCMYSRGASFKQLLHAANVAPCVVLTAGTTTNHCPLQDLGAAWPPALSPVQTVATVVQATIAEDVLSVRCMALVGR